MYEPDRRRSEYCDIWGLVASQQACPACSGEVAVRWEQERSASAGTAEAAVVEETEETEIPSFLDLPGPTGDVRAQASELLGLLAS